MIEIRDGYELGLLLRVMSCIDIVDYMQAGLDHDTACKLLTPDKFSNFIRLGDEDQAKAAGVIMARYQPQAERARARAVPETPPELDPDRLREDRDERRRLAAEDGV